MLSDTTTEPAQTTKGHRVYALFEAYLDDVELPEGQKGGCITDLPPELRVDLENLRPQARLVGFEVTS